MAVLVKMPIHVYLGFLGRCSLLSREYAILKNSVVDRAPVGDWSVVEILCQVTDANLILELGNRFYPLAVPYVQEGLTRANAYPTVEYRKSATGVTWHFSSDCSQWPTADYASTNDLLENSEVCNECIVKKQHGEHN